MICDALTRLKQAVLKRAPTSGNNSKRSGLAAPATADTEETAYDLASRAGLIGCLKGGPRSPTDLSTNPKHMRGFGRE